MNKAEKEARKIYNKNKELVGLCGAYLSSSSLRFLAREQNKLYKIFNARADNRNFTEMNQPGFYTPTDQSTISAMNLADNKMFTDLNQ